MTNYDLIVGIPWFIFSVALILICIRLQRSSRRPRNGPAQPGQRAKGPGAEPVDDPHATSPSGRDSLCVQDADRADGGRYPASRPALRHRVGRPRNTTLACAGAAGRNATAAG